MPFDVKSDRETAFGELLWCGNCGLGFSKRMPGPEEIAAHYDLPSYYTQSGSHMQEKRPTLLERLLIKAAWTFDHGARLDPASLRETLPEGGTALDIGCGNGAMLERLRDVGFEVLGVEPDPIARSRAGENGFAVLDGTAEDLPAEVTRRHFQLVLMTHVLEHCTDPGAALTNVLNILDDDGILYCEVPNCGSIYFQTYAAISEMLDVPRHLHFFTRTSLEIACTSAGLEIIGWRHRGLTRHHHPAWCAWENSIHRRLVARGEAPRSAARSLPGSALLLLREVAARPERKYDSIGFFARRAPQD